MDLQYKISKLKNIISDLEIVAVAYSGGVDSTLLLKISKDVLGENVIAITCKSVAIPYTEIKEAKDYAKNMNIDHFFFDMDVFQIEEFKYNSKDRCYHCKYEMFKNIERIAKENGIYNVIDGSIVDDEEDFRPGAKAIKELSVISPLKEAGLNKKDIREISKHMELPTWNKQSNTCFASRIPYGSEISGEKINMIQKSENVLTNMGFKQVRVRHHGDIARIEVGPNEMVNFFDMKIIGKVTKELKKVGFTYVTLDLSGYKTGSMNQTL